MGIEEAIRRFRRAAIAKGDFADSEEEDHSLFETMKKAWLVLDEAGAAGREAFTELLNDDSRHIRCWVASQLLALGDDSGVGILEADAAAGGIQGFNSKMVLREWREGRLGPPFFAE